jgi:hypothetical protein
MLNCSDQVQRELADVEVIARDIAALVGDTTDDSPNSATMAAIAMYMVNLYRAIEKILELIARELKVPVPVAKDWHSQLLNMFSEPPTGGLPALVSNDIAEPLKAYRGFRSVVQNAYAMRLRWDALKPNAVLASVIVSGFRRNVDAFLSKE